MRNTNRSINAVIAYATEPGQIALASTEPGQLSPFTRSLINHLNREGAPFSKVMRETAADVRISTNPEQVPGTFNWSQTDPFFRPSRETLDAEKEAWVSVRGTTYSNVQRFYYLHSVSRYAEAARRWMQQHPDLEDSTRFTRVSPLVIERAWRSNSTEETNIRRIETSVAFTRSIEMRDHELSAALSDTDLGLLPAGTTTAELRQLTTGEKYLEIELGHDWEKSVAARKLAFSVANLDAHQQVVAAQALTVREDPTLSAKIVDRIPMGAQFELTGVVLGKDQKLWLSGTKPGETVPFYFRAEPAATPAILELGRSLKEIIVSPRSNSLIDLVEPAPIHEAIAELKQRGHSIIWVSLSTAATNDQFERDVRASRLANAEYILKSRGISGTRITSVLGSSDFAGDGVRIRFFGK